jgi:hypothetical protein
MEQAEIVTAVHEMAEFASKTGRSMQSHREALTRHEEILTAMHKAGVSHRDQIQALSRDLSSLGELVNSQSQLILSMQKVMVKILQVLDLPTPGEITGKIN